MFHAVYSSVGYEININSENKKVRSSQIYHFISRTIKGVRKHALTRVNVDGIAHLNPPPPHIPSQL